MIDTRYPPQPREVRIPLYPLAARQELPNDDRGGAQRLRILIASVLTVSPELVVLGPSARAVLTRLLSWRFGSKRAISVGLPSFYCPHTAARLLSSGIRLVFLDIQPDLSLNPQSVAFAQQQGCDVLIWPSYFGLRRRRPDTLAVAHEAMLPVIFDDAHCFPTMQESGPPTGAMATLFSFGHNKPVAGVGGGGVQLADTDAAVEFASYARAVNAAEASTVMPRTTGAVPGRWFADQRDHLEQLVADELGSAVQRGTSCALSDLKIDECVSGIALARWRRRANVARQHGDYVGSLLRAVEGAWGEQAVHFMAGVADLPSILTLRVPAPRRYRIASALADRGIQSTWYYYPLHRLSPFAHCSAEAMVHCEAIAAETLMLPCQWTHTEMGCRISPEIFAETIEAVDT